MKKRQSGSMKRKKKQRKKQNEQAKNKVTYFWRAAAIESQPPTSMCKNVMGWKASRLFLPDTRLVLHTAMGIATTSYARAHYYGWLVAGEQGRIQGAKGPCSPPQRS